MVSLSINIQLVLVISLLILQQQQTSAYTLFGKLRKKQWLKFTSMQNNHDSMDDSIAFAGGIRKMLKQEQMADDISVTGDAEFDSMKTPHMNAQVDSQILKKNHERSKKEESNEFVDVDDEIAKLMNKDYSGKSKPRRSKPPINNHKPTD
ncbi:uncharacterized protein LOC129874372 [Solanum dulcamara]|uniref:uncharacterized protein LOC129874372 n=1 Tax=Solanum dulcamara TaxID=45834 RepID=UPI0024866D7B|nr:uncharacterized protein LOC129874372 [Solanum dulcamara]